MARISTTCINSVPEWEIEWLRLIRKLLVHLHPYPIWHAQNYFSGVSIMATSRKHLLVKIAVFCLLAALIPLPKPREKCGRNPCGLQGLPWTTQVNYWKHRQDLMLFLLNPQSLGYMVMFFALALFTLLVILDVFLKAVFYACNFGVFLATYSCTLHKSPSSSKRYNDCKFLSLFVPSFA